MDKINKYKLECYEGVRFLPSKYNALFLQYSEDELFLSRSWFELFEYFVVGCNDQLRIYGLVRSDQEEVAVFLLPLWLKSSSSGKIKALSSLSNYYSGNYEPLYAKESVSLYEVFSEFLKMMEDRRDWHTIDLRSLVTNGGVFNTLETGLSDSLLSYQKYFMSGNWYLPSKSCSYEEIVCNRPSVLKNTIRRKGKKLDQLDNALIEILLGSQIDEGRINDYWAVYENSWKSEESHKPFINELINNNLVWTAVLGLVYLDDKPIAAQLWFVSGTKLFIYKLSHLEEFRDMSVGTILLDRVMSFLYEKYNVSEIDFLTGDDGYKKQWMTCRRELWGVLLFNNKTLIGRMSAWLNIYGQKIKRMARILARIDNE